MGGLECDKFNVRLQNDNFKTPKTFYTTQL